MSTLKPKNRERQEQIGGKAVVFDYPCELGDLIDLNGETYKLTSFDDLKVQLFDGRKRQDITWGNLMASHARFAEVAG